MKRIIIILMSVGLLSTSMTFTIMSPKRLWQCRPSNQNPTPPCSAAERANSRKWLVGGTATVIGSILATLGIAAGVAEVRREQATAKKKEGETSVLESEFDQINRNIKDLNQDLNALQEKLKQATTIEEIERIENQITATQQLIDNLTVSGQLALQKDVFTKTKQ